MLAKVHKLHFKNQLYIIQEVMVLLFLFSKAFLKLPLFSTFPKGRKGECLSEPDFLCLLLNWSWQSKRSLVRHSGIDGQVLYPEATLYQGIYLPEWVWSFCCFWNSRILRLFNSWFTVTPIFRLFKNWVSVYNAQGCT